MFLLEDKSYFWLLLLIPITSFLFFRVWLWRNKIQAFFMKNPKVAQRLAPERSKFKFTLKFILSSLSIISLIVALVNPRAGTKVETLKRKGVDIVFAMDVSRSMLCQDVAPNRLERSKQIATQLVNNFVGNRVGVIAYAGKAIPQVPITTDYGAAKLFLTSLSTDMLSSQGTAISQALQISKKFFSHSKDANKALVILSDGEDHSSNTQQKLKNLVKEGISVYTIGVGTAKGGPIPIEEDGKITSYKKDRLGEPVITRLDIINLQRIAKEGKGNYIHASNTQSVIKELTTALQKMEQKEYEAKQFTDFEDQFQWFLGLGILLLVLEFFIFPKRTSWVVNTNLFNEKNK